MDGRLMVLVGPRLVHTGEPADTFYIRPASGDTGAVLGKFAQYVWMQTSNGMLAPRDAYPAQALVTGTATAGFAFSDGLQYEVRWWRPNASPHWMRVERAWVPPSPGIDRNPPESLVATLRGGTELAEMIGSMQRGDHKYSLEQIALMPGGALWVRPVDSSYVYHPWYYNQLTELRQPTRLWEVFGSDGKLRAQARVSSMFTPWTVQGCKLYGFLEGSDGAFSVATIPLGDECEKLGEE
jgi:hypothetical protein